MVSCKKCKKSTGLPSWNICQDCEYRSKNFNGITKCPDCKLKLPAWEYPRLTDLNPQSQPTCLSCLSVKLKKITMKEFIQNQKEEGKSMEEARNNLAEEYGLSKFEAGEIIQKFVSGE